MSARVADRARRQRGYTLIELLAAIAIMSVAIGVVAPGLLSGLNRAGLYAARIEFASAIDDLRREAFDEARPILLIDGMETSIPAVSGERRRVTLTSDWQYALVQPVAFSPAGICSGGLVRIEKGGLGTDMRLTAPKCELERLER